MLASWNTHQEFAGWSKMLAFHPLIFSLWKKDSQLHLMAVSLPSDHTTPKLRYWIGHVIMITENSFDCLMNQICLFGLRDHSSIESEHGFQNHVWKWRFSPFGLGHEQSFFKPLNQIILWSGLRLVLKTFKNMILHTDTTIIGSTKRLFPFSLNEVRTNQFFWSGWFVIWGGRITATTSLYH